MTLEEQDEIGREKKKNHWTKTLFFFFFFHLWKGKRYQYSEVGKQSRRIKKELPFHGKKATFTIRPSFVPC